MHGKHYYFSSFDTKRYEVNSDNKNEWQSLMEHVRPRPEQPHSLCALVIIESDKSSRVKSSRWDSYFVDCCAHDSTLFLACIVSLDSSLFSSFGERSNWLSFGFSPN